MAEIALRDYLAEIDTLIEGSAYDEAVSHCRHLLGQQPKCLEVYRLLGKAALEKEDDKATVDLFQRVLSVDPEDFVARVGLSIVYDRQGALDDAMWQMERGFELMPSNDVIQSELRRLYGRRDGVEPDRIALTRGALARMYAQGDLYDEAVAELRALLKDSPDRLDLQVLLAETLWRNEQRNEAVAVAERILDRYPHCLSANLILGEIWLNTGFAEDGEMLLRRAQAVDPDNARAAALLGAASPLSEQTTRVERLEYQSQFGSTAEPVSDQVPDWLAGLAGLTTLEQPESAGLPGLPPPSSAPAIELGPTSTDLPDWLQTLDQAAPAAETPTETADWTSSMWEASQPAPGEPAGPPSMETAPDWLSPPGESSVQPAQSELEAKGSATDWLTQITEPETAAPAGADMPDWLSRVAETPAADIPTEAPAEVPGWLSDLGAPAAPAPAEAPSELPQAELPDWLQAMRPPEPEIVEPAIEVPEVDESEMPEWMAEAQEAPPTDAALDFLQRLGETAQVEPVEEPPAPEAAMPAADEAMPSPDDALAFFARLTAGKEDELRAQAEKEAEARMADITGKQPAAAPPVEKPAPAAPVAPPAPRPVAPPAPAVAELAAMPSPDDALAFLQSLTVGKEDQLRAEAERAADERMADITGKQPSVPPPADKPAPPAPIAAPSAVAEWEAMPSPEDALAFLQSLTVGKEEQLRAEAERVADERMDAIMGGKPGTSPLRPPTKPLTPPESLPQPVPPPADELLSPDAALAFLESLTVGKEEQLRAEAERVADERMDAIMGGKPGTSPLRPPTKPLKPPEPEPPPAPEPAPTMEAAPPPPVESMEVEEEALAFLETLTAPPPAVETPIEVTPIGRPIVEETLPAEPPAPLSLWLQTADDEGGAPIAPDYLDRASMPAPAPPPKATRPALRRAQRAEPEPAPLPRPVAPILPPLGAEEYASRLQANPADHEARLSLARVWWAAGDQANSLQMYQQLVEDEMFLDEVAGDLQRDLESFEHADWYRVLGDANMKLGHLPEALDAYRQALTHL